MDQVGVVELISVGVEDPAILIGVSVEALRDLREVVSRRDGVAARLGT